MISLYADSDFLSPYAMSAFVALKVKGLAFELRKVDLDAQENMTDGFFGASLTSRVPTLIDGEFSLSESSAIAEYLEEKIPLPRLFPSNLQERARARQIQAWLRSDLMSLRIERSTEVVFLKPTERQLSESAKEAATKVIKVATSLLSDGRVNIFNEWCIADVDLALMLNRLVNNRDDVPEALVRYVRHQWEHPAIQDWIGLERL